MYVYKLRAALSRRGDRLLAPSHGGRLDVFVESQCRHPWEVPVDRKPFHTVVPPADMVDRVTLYRAPTTAADADTVDHIGRWYHCVKRFPVDRNLPRVAAL